MDHMTRLANTDRYLEMLQALSPRELSAVALRLDDLDCQDIADLFGTRRQTIQNRLASARHKIRALFPELHTAIEGRNLRAGLSKPTADTRNHHLTAARTRTLHAIYSILEEGQVPWARPIAARTGRRPENIRAELTQLARTGHLVRGRRVPGPTGRLVTPYYPAPYRRTQT